MSDVTKAHRPDLGRPSPPVNRSLPAPAPVLFLQRSGLGPAAFVSGVSDTLGSGSAALPPAIRADMESRFQQDFSSVRIHDDARAHDSARTAQAAAYTVGDHIVFGSGRYQPETSSGRHLLAHELAHTVQQVGVQYRRLDGMALDGHAGLEHEADHAASSALHGGAPAPLTRVGLPRLARAPESTPDPDTEPKEHPAPKVLVKPSALPTVDQISTAELGAGKSIVVDSAVPLAVLPKGEGAFVEPLWKKYAQGGNLVFTGKLAGKRLPAIKEVSASSEYRDAWLGSHGFKSMADLGTALTDYLKEKTEPVGPLRLGLEKAAKDFSAGGLGGSTVANIDHIVEKQVGGASIPENLQILNAQENQSSGRALNRTLVEHANAILDQQGRAGVAFISIRFKEVTYAPSSAKDAYGWIEHTLRSNPTNLPPTTRGKPPGADGDPILLQSGAATAKISANPTGQTAIAQGGVNDSARRLISGLDLMTYVRPGGKGKKGPAGDTVNAVVDAERLKTAIQPAPGKKANEQMTLDATEATAAGPAASGGDTVRQLKISSRSKELDFVFPYLSPGKFTKLELAPDNSLHAEGYIEPTLKFLRRIDVVLAKDSFGLKADLGPANFQPPVPGFTVTEAAIGLQLAPVFKPSGTLKFSLGPVQKPYAVGSVTAGLEGGTFAVNGTLTAQNVPGIDHGSGTVRYTAAEGWSAELKAVSSKLPKSKAEVVLGFTSKGGKAQMYAGGSIKFDIGAGKDLTIMADYRNEKMVYSGELTWDKPIKFVDQVRLHFRYDGENIVGTGSTTFTYKKFNGDIKVHYRKKGDEPAKLSGEGEVAVKTDRAQGLLKLGIDPNGVVSGQGSVSYLFSDKLRPTVGVILHPDGHLTLTGKIEITQPIQLFPRYPASGGERDLIKVNLDFVIPGPFPGLADPMVHLGAGVRFSYGVGPGQIVNTVIEGSFDPLEENKNAKLKFTSTFEVPGHVGLIGVLEGGLGVAVLGGLLAKAHAGLRVEPSFTLNLVSKVPVTAEYENGDFSFEGRLEMTGGLSLALAIKLYAHVEAIGGALEKDFTYDLKNYDYDVGQQMTLTLAKIGYSTKTGFKAPSLSDIKISPGDIDPIAMIKKVAGSAKAALAGQG